MTSASQLENAIIESYRRVSPQQAAWIKRRFGIIPFGELEKTAPLKGSIYDLGCGRGEFALLLALASAKRRVVGIDLAKERLTVAKRAGENVPNLTFSLKDISHIKGMKADAIYLNEVLYLIDFAKQRQILANCFSGLNKGGRLVIKLFNLRQSRLFPTYKYYLASWQTRGVHLGYRFLETAFILCKWASAQKKLEGILGKRKRGPFFWTEKELTAYLEKLGFRVKTKNLKPESSLPHPVYICQK